MYFEIISVLQKLIVLLYMWQFLLHFFGKNINSTSYVF